MSESPTYQFVGGQLCLDFANTVNGHNSDHPGEKVHTYGDLLAWGRQANLLTRAEEQSLSREAERHPAQAAAVLNDARQLREAVFHIFMATTEHRAPATEDLEILNTALSEALGRSRVIHKASGFGWDWAGEADSLDRVLWPVARSAADLLTSGNLGRVRNCAHATCGWLFYDSSRNNSRRWCDMNDCGNREKVRRHYQRQRAAAAKRK